MKGSVALKIVSFGMAIVFVGSLCFALRREEAGVRLLIRCSNGKYGFINEKGTVIIPPVWDHAGPFRADGTSRVSKKSRNWVRFNRSIGFPYLQIGEYAESKSYAIDRMGKVVRNNEKRRGAQSKELDAHGMMLVRAGGYHWVRANGVAAFPGKWDHAFDFQDEGLAAVKKNGRWGFINRKGEIVIPYEWGETRGFGGNGLACVAVGSNYSRRRWGIIDSSGQLVVPLYFDRLSGFDDFGMCGAEAAGRAGFINEKGAIVVPFRYQWVEKFDSYGMARVAIHKPYGKIKHGWVDRVGNTVIPTEFDETNYRREEWDLSVLSVRKDKAGSGLLDRKGRLVVGYSPKLKKMIKDLYAPRRGWITIIGANKELPSSSKFVVACYSDKGDLIWDGDVMTNRFKMMSIAGVSGVLAVLTGFILWRGTTPFHPSQIPPTAPPKLLTSKANS